MKIKVTQKRANRSEWYIHIWLKLFYEYCPRIDRGIIVRREIKTNKSFIKVSLLIYVLKPTTLCASFISISLSEEPL